MLQLIKGKRAAIGCVFLILIIFTAVCWQTFGTLFTPGNYGTIDEMAESVMARTATPGVARVSSKQGKLEFKGYGYADVGQHKLVTEESLFELGSTTKAFTALAVILLQEEGRLASSDQVSDYLPWFAPTFHGAKAEITINQLLAHTSGIPSWSIKLISEGTTAEMLATTVHNISEIALDTSPGTEHQYATVNYDVLALLIEQITGISYQDYITQNILTPLGMTGSYFSTGQEKTPDQLTSGYRVFFGKSLAYDAPRYYGNIAAGYLVTNAKDLGRWMNAQMGIGEVPDTLRAAIEQSHMADLQTAGYEAEGQYYSYGWSNEPDQRVISHSGSNPNYSSQVIIDLAQQEAVFVLANLNSTAPSLIARNVYKNMNGQAMASYTYDDSNILIDFVFSFLVLPAAISICLKVIRLGRRHQQITHADRLSRRKRLGAFIKLVVRLVLLVLILTWPYLIDYNYYMLSVWMSYSILLWMGLAAVSCLLSVILQLRRIVTGEDS